MNADELAQSIRSKHDKLETDCKQTVLAVELVALQMKVAALTARVAQLERDELERTQTQEQKSASSLMQCSMQRTIPPSTRSSHGFDPTASRRASILISSESTYLQVGTATSSRSRLRSSTTGKANTIHSTRSTSQVERKSLRRKSQACLFGSALSITSARTQSLCLVSNSWLRQSSSRTRPAQQAKVFER